MAQFDKFILAMFNKEATELLLVAEAKPLLFHGDKQSVLTPNVPTAKQIRHLGGEIAPQAARVKLTTEGSATFNYQPASGPPVQITISEWRHATSIRVKAASVADAQTEVDQQPELAAPAPVAEAPSTDAAPPAPTEVDPEEHYDDGNQDRIQVPEISGGHPIDALFHTLVKSGSSDLHMSSNEIPMLRKDGEMARLDYKRLGSDDLYALLEPIMPETNKQEFESDGDTDFAYEIRGLARFRANMFRDRHGVGAVFRTIPAEILTAEQLQLSPAICDLSKLSKGLVLVTGPTGSGKSTTLCALIDLINRTRSAHIITIEDPIEFVHPNKRCLVNQREVGVHTQGFKRALRAALREDPDIVLVGEMRDLETIAIAIETAETGHLVFGTLHTSTAYSTIDRIIDQFPPDQQEQIRVMLSESLRGVISQTLCKKIGGGRVAALEVLLSTPAVANLIREGKTFQIPSIMQTNKKLGMVLLNEALMAHILAKRITVEEAIIKAVDKQTLKTMLQNAGVPFDTSVGQD